MLPWRTLLKRAAKSYGVIDPGAFVERLRRFSRPSEVQEPIELLRAGIVFHARGLINTKAIQHNMDWVWPHWVEKQFNPSDPSFIPRAFSFSHTNLTHRNWTAVGLPELDVYPIVDPRGLVTPLYDGWSLDFWILSEEGTPLLPSRESTVRQSLHLSGEHAVVTRFAAGKTEMEQRVEVVLRSGEPVLKIGVNVSTTERGARLAVAIRPYNPEGIQFIDTLQCNPRRDAWTVNGVTPIFFDRPADDLRTSHYECGDVYHGLHSGDESGEETCPVGLATAASLFEIPPDGQSALEVAVPLEIAEGPRSVRSRNLSKTWREAESDAAKLRVPDGKIQFLYDAAIHTLTMLSAGEIYPGPYTYRRFWFRDACLMLNALLGLGLKSRCRRILDTFPDRQLKNGYFSSQEGEWDSNGQVLWIFARYRAVTGETLPEKWVRSAIRAMRWLEEKRLSSDSGNDYPGLLPAGFSAEHLGTNDYYYWDDFWAAGGLRAIAPVFEESGHGKLAKRARRLADEFLSAIENSLPPDATSRGESAFPAAPGRRMDSGSVGSLVADYPLQIFPAGEGRIMATAEYLLEHSFHGGGFFQQMIHSGINAYLTLDIAQTLLRAGDPRFADLFKSVADLASPTGQWPEAIHPNTLGGCMGDGQHGWAAAEWILMIRSCFVREEGDRLILCSGLLPEWLTSEEVAFGPTQTPWGEISVSVVPKDSGHLVSLDARWRGDAPPITIELPGRGTIGVENFSCPYWIPPQEEDPKRPAQRASSPTAQMAT